LILRSLERWIALLLLLPAVVFAAEGEPVSPDLFGPPAPAEPEPVRVIPRVVTMAPGGPLLQSPVLARVDYYRAVHGIGSGRWEEARQKLILAVQGDPSLVRGHLLLSMLHLREHDPRWILSLGNALRALLGNFRSQSLLVANGVLFFFSLLFVLLSLICAVAVLRNLPSLRHSLIERLPSATSPAIGRLLPPVLLLSVVLLLRPWAWLAGYAWLTVVGILLVWKGLRRSEKWAARAYLVYILLFPAIVRVTVHATIPATPGTVLYALSEASLAPLNSDKTTALLNSQPRDREILFSLALLEREKGNSERAIDLYKEILLQGYESPAVYNNIGNLLFLTGDFDRARGAYQRALALDPKSAASHYNLGQLHLEAFAFEEARDEFSKASEINFSLIRTLSHVGRTEQPHILVDQPLPPSQLWARFLAGRAGHEEITWKEAAAAARNLLFPFPLSRALFLAAILLAAAFYGSRRPRPHSCRRCGRALCRICRVRRGRMDLCKECAKELPGRVWARKTILYHRPMSLSLSLLLPGSAHCYLGRPLRGIFYLLITLSIVLLWASKGPALKPFPVLYSADLASVERLVLGWLVAPFYLFVLVDSLLLIRRSFRNSGGGESA